MARGSDDGKKKRQRLSAPDMELAASFLKVSESADPVSRVVEAAEVSSKVERVLRPRKGVNEGLSVDSPKNASLENGKVNQRDTFLEDGIDMLLSLHNGEPNALQSGVHLSGDAQAGEERAISSDAAKRESLESLRSFLEKHDGLLGEGWDVEIQKRSDGKVNKIYFSPAGEKFRSRVEVAKHMGLFDSKKPNGGSLFDSKKPNGGSGISLDFTRRGSKNQKDHVLVDNDDIKVGDTKSDAAGSVRTTFEGSQDQLLSEGGAKHTHEEAFSGESKKNDVPARVQPAHRISEISKADKPLISDKVEATKVTDKSQIIRKNPPSPTLITQRCQDVLRGIISAEKFGTLSNMLNCGTPLGSLDTALQFKAPTLISGSLDLHLIAIRMSAGTYGQTPEMFSADMQQVWDNITSVGNELVNSAKTLSEMSKNMYKEQVLSLFPVDFEERGGLLNKNPDEEQDLLCRREHHKQQVAGNGQFQNDTCVSKETNAQSKNLPGKGARKGNAQKSGLESGVPSELSVDEQITLSYQAVGAKSQDLNNSPAANKTIARTNLSQQSTEQVKRKHQSKTPKAVKSITMESACKECGLNQGADCVICSRCNAGYHRYCITSISTTFPENGWCCPSCTSKTVMEDPHVVSFVKQRKEGSNNIQDLSLVPNQSADGVSFRSIEPVKITGKGGVCKACGKEDDNVLLCDTCDAAFHMNCLTPAIERVPDGNWYCPACVEAGKEPMITHELEHDEDHHCSVCDRIHGKSLAPIETEPTPIEDEPATIEYEPAPIENESAEQIIISTNETVCKICGADKSKKLSVLCLGCEKFYHLSCLTPPLKKFPRGTWFCPSCLCRVCKIDENDEKILLCDTCDEGYHTYCLSPPLTDVPEGTWFCPSCVKVESPMGRSSSEDVIVISSEDKKSLSEVSKRKRKSTEPRRSF